MWRQRGAATPKQRLADLRSIRQLVPGSHAEFYTARDRMLSLIALLTRMPEMMFWDAAEGEDLADIYESILEMEDYCVRLREALDLRAVDDETREKIEKLQEVRRDRGASDGEVANAKASIARLRRKLA